MFLFIINEAAGNGKALLHWRKMEDRLRSENIPFEKMMSCSEKDTRQFIVNMSAQHELKAIGVIGGDGTISSVLQEIAGTKIPLAIFPAGSGNDTARMFRLTRDPNHFIEKLCTFEMTQIDLIQANDRFGVTVAGIGIDTVIGEKVNRSIYKPFFNKMRMGPLAYIIGAIQVALTFPAFHTTVTVNGTTKTLEKTWLLASGNTASYGGGLTVCPNANPTDGQLNITIFHSLARFKALCRIFPALLTGVPIKKNGVSYLQGTDIRITTDRPISAILDGEIIATTPLHIKIHPKALSLLLTN